jgi:hypothetical protein
MERNRPVDVETLVATSSPAPAPAPRRVRWDWRTKAIVVLVGIGICGAVLQGLHQRRAAEVEAQRARAEQAARDQVDAEGRARQLAARLEEVQACNSEPRIGEPEAILMAYAECHGARVQETRVLGRAAVRVYAVAGSGSWTVEEGLITSRR